ncbi:EamA/RhaT family transporter [Rhizobium sullae]|uniref:EamA/RhaT family transporter n=1 Tax=Rhizobium sullae TaxID=50338 RepID=A0A2N0DDT1_RHISU|nr:DMT family transporter [Rhizobium sullae]PKA44206.1 EamA/RhaT family transporter [Rhizobium sullae]
MLIGVLCGLATCALWGLTFVVPRAIAPFNTMDLTIARYGLFAVASVVLMVNPRFRPRNIKPRLAVTALLLGGVGYVGYFVSVAYAVRLVGAAIPPLVIGTMPVILAIIANFRDRSVAWQMLALPLLLIAAGIGWVNVSIFSATPSGDEAAIILGIGSTLIGLALWVIYGLASTAAMQSPEAPDILQWTGLQGIGAGIGSLVLIPFTSIGTGIVFTGAELLRFILWSLIMGLAGAWLATLLWMIASKRLPLALAAQLIVAETIFGLIFGFLFEQRLPTLAEAGGSILQLAGVGLAIAIFTPNGRRA